MSPPSHQRAAESQCVHVRADVNWAFTVARLPTVVEHEPHGFTTRTPRNPREDMTTPWNTTDDVARRMSRQARRDTRPETALRSALHAAGRRFRVAYPVPGRRRCTIDIAFPRRRVAVFVDGCFWHGCPEHGTQPKSNVERWAAKLASNRDRDRHVDALLRDLGWVVVRVWEHEELEPACARVLRALDDQELATG